MRTPKKGGRELGREGAREGGRELGREGAREGGREEGGREGGVTDCYTYSNIIQCRHSI